MEFGADIPDQPNGGSEITDPEKKTPCINNPGGKSVVAPQEGGRAAEGVQPLCIEDDE